MNECCKETFRLALIQVLNMINENKPLEIKEVVSAIEYAINILDKKGA